MTIFIASNVSTRKYSVILCTDFSTFNVTHKLLKQVLDSVRHMFRWKQPRISKINSANQKFLFENIVYKVFLRSTGVFWITNTVSCESPTELIFPQPLGVTTFVFKQINAFLEVFRIVGHCLHIGCPRKCNSHSHQPCHLALNKSSTCQVSKISSWKTRYFSDPPRVTFFNVCTPYNRGRHPLQQGSATFC